MLLTSNLAAVDKNLETGYGTGLLRDGMKL